MSAAQMPVPGSPPKKRSLSLRQRYRQLNFWNKLAFWGSIASILALLIGILLPFSTPSGPDANQIAAAVLAKLSEQGQTARPWGAGGPPLDFPAAFREAAKQFHTTPQEAERVVRQWVAESQNSPNLSKRAEAEFLARNFPKAAELADQAARDNQQRLAQLTVQFTKERDALISAMVENLRRAGAALCASGQLPEALDRFEKALRCFSRAESEETWACLQNWLGICHEELAIRVVGPSARRHTDAAIAAYRAALDVYTRREFPEAWALTQHNLGIALRDQGARSSGPEAGQLLAEAVKAYRAALEVRTRHELPQAWAVTQNNLGNALREQATSSSGPEAGQLLGEAVKACRAALEVYSPQRELPRAWAATQNSLGDALNDQATRSSGPEAGQLLGEAVKAYRAVLEVYTRQEFPRYWSATQKNLAMALTYQAALGSAPEAGQLLDEAVKAYRAVLEVYTRQEFPQDWAATQKNLAKALSGQAALSSGPEAGQLLAEAVKAYQAVLEVWTRQELPQDWAATQNNLGDALNDQATRSNGPEAVELLAEAVKAHRAALQL